MRTVLSICLAVVFFFTLPFASSDPVPVDPVASIPEFTTGSVEASEPSLLPVAVTIPSIGLHASIDALGLGEDDLQIIPTDPTHASWYNLGPKPGELGSAVIAGHFFWGGAPGVFNRLSEVHAGDTIVVNREDGTRVTFRVEKTAVYDVPDFPTADIYAQYDAKRLNLVTCHGEYIAETNDYSQRLVIYSTLASNPSDPSNSSNPSLP